MSEFAGLRYLCGSLVAVLLASVLLTRGRRSKRRHLAGPPPKFLVGNLKDLPTGGHEWDQYAKMSELYGSDVLYMTALGTGLLVINSFEAAHDLLDKRGSVYSDRPRLVMIKELMKWDWNLILMSYGKDFTTYRRVVQQEFQPSTVSQLYHPIMATEVAALLDRLLTSPEDLIQHFRLMAGAIIMMVTYGHKVDSVDDKYVALAEAVREYSAQRPGTELVDVFPILKYLPSWFPGAGFQKYAAIGKELSIQMRSAPFKMVKDRLASGTASPSLASRLLHQSVDTGGIDQDKFAQNTCAVVYSAGADTTLAAMINFILAMTLYPEVQERAHRELDDVVGRDRLPNFSDKGRLPYVSNVVKETLRWKAVAPLGVPHATVSDDIYRDGYVPKGTTVIANISAMLHDPSVYSDPGTFNPDRFFSTEEKPDGEPDPARAAFGFGRRICPGRYFAEDSLWLAIASLLHVFAITNPDGRGGNGVTGIRWSSGLVSLPSPFPHKLAPRFSKAAELVSAADRT
ncbi:cytochrome P450 [Polyporus arcularius HHB13444]|uniref:Cytochrome P450 n=1 Tax=Polyporus arcularius HHB13444 TaxID=1314778 RepID=A0A5C3P0Z9_9APHY|nr:cytochrome P450 [Polyporus arcularius HHB13444]